MKTEIKNTGGASQLAVPNSSSAEPAPWGARLRAARGWHESAYEWRLVSYAMHAQAILNVHDAGGILYHIPTVDKPSVYLGRHQFDEMRARPKRLRHSQAYGLAALAHWHGDDPH